MIRYTVLIRVLFPIVAVLLGWGALAEFSRGTLFTKAAWSVLAIMGVVAAAETLVGRIELRPESLIIIGPLERRVYPRDRIVRLRAVWKVGLFVELADSSTVKLETIGFMGRQAIPTLRAWLHKTRPQEPGENRAAEQGVSGLPRQDDDVRS